MRTITPFLIMLSLIVGIVGIMQLHANQTAFGISILYYLLSWGLFMSGLSIMKKNAGE